MRRPTLSQSYGFVFMTLGAVFIPAGYLNKIGILSTTQYSKGGPTTTFTVVGGILLIVGAVLFFISLYREKERAKLKEKGIKVEGYVTDIKRLIYTKVNKQAPYVVYFSYDYNGDNYKGKSHLLWDKPSISKGDLISIYIDEYKKHSYFTETQ